MSRSILVIGAGLPPMPCHPYRSVSQSQGNILRDQVGRRSHLGPMDSPCAERDSAGSWRGWRMDLQHSTPSETDPLL